MNLYEAKKILNGKNCKLIKESTPKAATPDDPYYQFYEDVTDCYMRLERYGYYNLDEIERRIKRRFGSNIERLLMREVDGDEKIYHVGFVFHKNGHTGIIVVSQSIWLNDKSKSRIWPDGWGRAWWDTGEIDPKTLRGDNAGWHPMGYRRGWDCST